MAIRLGTSNRHIPEYSGRSIHVVLEGPTTRHALDDDVRGDIIVGMGDRDWSVRPARTTDVEAIQAVAGPAWRDAYTGLLRAETIDTFLERAYASDRLERRISQHAFLVAEEDERVVAFADAVEEPDRVKLAAIYALPALRGLGVGTRLLAALRSRFARRPFSANVVAGNRKGEVFYERRGFVPGEAFEVDLFGERVVERCWWLAPPTPPSRG
jgi:GNAT superfamily N-acetyltransferase